MISYNKFFQNFQSIVERVAEAARASGRNPKDVTVLPVTKTHPAEAVEFVVRAGLDRIGENRVAEASEKRSGFPSVPPQWDLIGHLQSNKAALALRTFDRFQSVDSLKLAVRLDRLAGETGLRPECFLQINTGRDPRKFGFAPEEIPTAIEQLAGLDHLSITGLMTIGPLDGGRSEAGKAFARLRELAVDLRRRSGLLLPELSMGMSGDLEEAVAEGSTLVRIGSALFGERG